MNFPYKAVLFDWAYTLVDLVCEDDRVAFSEMMKFLKSKRIIIDPRTRNFPRFAKNNGIIFKIIERVGSGGRAPALYKKPTQEKILKIKKLYLNCHGMFIYVL